MWNKEMHTPLLRKTIKYLNAVINIVNWVSLKIQISDSLRMTKSK